MLDLKSTHKSTQMRWDTLNAIIPVDLEVDAGGFPAWDSTTVRYSKTASKIHSVDDFGLRQNLPEKPLLTDINIIFEKQGSKSGIFLRLPALLEAPLRSIR